MVNQRRGPINLDLFASPWNCQVPRFFSWRNNPIAAGVDALTLAWPETGAYAFPPFILIPKTLEKIQREHIQVVVITPIWKTACWYSKLLQMSVALPL